VTHDAKFATHLAHEAAFFENGRITARACVNDIVERFGW
jgi:ABC-type sulfate/molybdate transport systems ATPase subunit